METYEDDNKIKILLVDDKIENLIAMKKTLSPLKLDLVTTQSGNEGLKLMLANDFAVVLLDVMMPDINGFEVAALMHENDQTKYIPIIFITAINKSDQNYIQGMEAGAIDFLYKPIDPVILLSKVRVFIDLYSVRNKLEKTILKLNDFQSQLQLTNLKLKQLSEEDALTKVSNRRHFENETLRLMDVFKNEGNQMALFFLDVDNFKNINDTYGHRSGDLVLQILTERIKSLAILPSIINANLHPKIIARLGGDEFAIVLAGDINSINNTEIFAKELLKVSAQNFVCEDKLIPVTISIGIACYPLSGDSLTELMRAADIALYQSKTAGKNTYSIFQSA
jgi:diguanylate cyclase (GGDEF)-like protein